LINSNELNQVISERAANWELERIAIMDTILIKMAITELIEFPSIPVKVSLNEYIELSKEYSSPKSKLFINGVLDKLIAEYKEKGIIKKAGRGLME
jgi:N utilization substance protein B